MFLWLQVNEGTSKQRGDFDLFFAQHESIMKSKTAEQLEAMRAAIVDIQQAVNKGKSANHEANAERLLQLFAPPPSSADSSSIWEIR